MRFLSRERRRTEHIWSHWSLKVGGKEVETDTDEFFHGDGKVKEFLLMTYFLQKETSYLKSFMLTKYIG